MIFGNYSNDFDKTGKINHDKKAQKANEQGVVKQDVIKTFYDRVRLNVPETGQFDTIVNEFTNPMTGDEYRLFVTPSHVKGEEDKRRLSLGIKIPDTGNMRHLQIMKGTKVEILDYIGNEKNIPEINALASELKEE